MKQAIFSIYDQKAAAFLPPFFLPNAPMAIRTFTDCVNDPSHAFHTNPDDYSLYCFGSFDNVKGEILPCESAELVVEGRSLVKEN